jgi:hypothetical protein
MQDALPARLAPGALVTYHGSLAEQHGVWTVVERCRCNRCEEAFDEAWDMLWYSLPARQQQHVAAMSEQYARYELTAENGDGLTCVRRSSITPLD